MPYFECLITFSRGVMRTYKKCSCSTLLQAFILILLIGGMQILVACAPTRTHQSYMYRGPGGFPSCFSNQQSIAVIWKPQPGLTTTVSRPDSIILKAELIGPFSSIDTFLHAVAQSKVAGSFAKNVLIVTASPAMVDSWTNRTITSLLPLPPNLKPGYYDINYTAIEQSHDNGVPMSTTRADAPVKFPCSYTA